MRRAVITVVVIAAVAMACRGGEQQTLVERLPDIVPQPEEIEQRLAPRFDRVNIEQGRFVPNEKAAEGFGSLVSLTGDLESGRVQGYLVSSKPCVRHCFGVSAAVHLYKDERSAQAAVETRYYGRGDPIPVSQFGDASIAWPMAGGESCREDVCRTVFACPCDFRFRVGPMVGRVSVSYGGFPLPTPGLDPAEVSLAKTMVIRMRKALQD